MSLFPAFVSARRRKDNPAPQPETAADSRQAESNDSDSDDNIFDLLPPKPAEAAAPQVEAHVEPQVEPQSRDVHMVDMTDLSRLSIDRDGRLYWDGKPVEIRRRISMSRAQVIGASIVAAFVAIGAIGSAIQGAAAARELACRLGWSVSSCSLPGQPRNASDIPA
ncbi:MAG: hypothetical protein QOF91_377 [Alphaproteobacteria bacterium]|jgi:hypothetical protein|nr:hypothetical protein [Alphaproteobacteria bacterium]